MNWDELEREESEKRAQLDRRESERRRDSESEGEWEKAPSRKRRRVRRVSRPRVKVMLWTLWEGGRVSLG